jgi:hypothetical protein
VTRSQHEATRARRRAEADWLIVYGWKQESPSTGNRWVHPNAPKSPGTYSQKDALTLTDADPLRFGSVR